MLYDRSAPLSPFPPYSDALPDGESRAEFSIPVQASFLSVGALEVVHMGVSFRVEREIRDGKHCEDEQQTKHDWVDDWCEEPFPDRYRTVVTTESDYRNPTHGRTPGFYRTSCRKCRKRVQEPAPGLRCLSRSTASYQVRRSRGLGVLPCRVRSLSGRGRALTASSRNPRSLSCRCRRPCAPARRLENCRRSA